MLKGNLIKIAIVDDDEDDYFIITSYIQNIQGANLRVEWISDYQTAIEKIKADHVIRNGGHFMVYNKAEEVSKAIISAVVSH